MSCQENIHNDNQFDNKKLSNKEWLAVYRKCALESFSPVIDKLRQLNQPFGLVEYGSLAYGDWVPTNSDWDAILVLQKGNIPSDKYSVELATAFSQIRMREDFKPTQEDLRRLLDGEIDSIFFHTVPEEGSDIDINITTMSALRRLFHYDPQTHARMRIKNWPHDVKNIQGINEDRVHFERTFKFYLATGTEVPEKRTGHVDGKDAETLDPGNKRIRNNLFLGFFYSRLMCTNQNSVLYDTVGLQDFLSLFRNSATRAIVFYNNLYQINTTGKAVAVRPEAYDVNWIVQTINRNERFSMEFKEEIEKWFFENLERLNWQLLKRQAKDN